MEELEIGVFALRPGVDISVVTVHETVNWVLFLLTTIQPDYLTGIVRTLKPVQHIIAIETL
jgi:hypothetical protein